MLHKYQITMRGTFDLGRWNGMLRRLYDMGIRYECETRLSPTRDDAGLLKYFDRVVFTQEQEIDLDYITGKEVSHEK